MLARRKANAAAKRDTPCAESIAMQRPDITLNPLVSARASLNKGGSPPASPSMNTPAYTIGTDGNLDTSLSDSYF
jgi:hypothetical protein